MTHGDPTTADGWKAKCEEMAAELRQATAERDAAQDRVLKLQDRLASGQAEFAKLANPKVETHRPHPN